MCFCIPQRSIFPFVQSSTWMLSNVSPGGPGVKGEKGDKGVGEMGDSGPPGAPGLTSSFWKLKAVSSVVIL